MLFLLSFTIFCYSQNQFQLALGFTGNDAAKSIIRTTNGGYAIAGITTSFGAGGQDMYVVLLNANGTAQLYRYIGGTGNDFAWSIIQTTDGGYAVAGGTNSYGGVGGGFTDLYIVKINPDGSILWTRTLGGTGNEQARSIIQTTDGGYALIGYTNSYGAGNYDIYVAKITSESFHNWSKAIGGTNDDYGYSIIQTTDGSYIILGETTSFGAGLSDIYILGIDGNGNLQWSKTLGGTGYDYAYGITKTTDGGFAITGGTTSFGAGLNDFYIAKFNSSGALQWNRTIGGTGDDLSYSIIQSTDGGYVVAGCTNSFGAGNYDMFIVKLNNNGTYQWSRTVGGGNYDDAFSISQTADGGYIASGQTSSFGAGGTDMYIVKFDANGNTCENTTSPSPSSGTGGTLLSQTTYEISFNPLITGGGFTSVGGPVPTTICVIGIKPISNEIPKSYTLSQNYPNPFNPSTRIKFDLPKSSFTKLHIYDILGREVARLVNEQLKPGTYEVEWNGSNYPSGVYFYKIIAGDFNAVKKMVLVK